TEVAALDAHRVRFDFGGRSNRELPLILGQLAILPKHYYENREFSRTTLEPPPGSGPYRVSEIDPGRAITYTLNDDYWGRDLPVNRGRFNFKHMRFDYYRDATVALTAFKSGEYDFRVENIAKQWATAYQGPPFDQGRILTESIAHQIPAGMQGFAMNQRRPLFSDRRVRYALAHAFDFEWTNRHLFYGMYRRTRSYFENSALAAGGLPTEAQMQLLNPLREHLWPEVFDRVYAPPDTRGEHGLRRNLLRALELLNQAGWSVENGILRHRETGQPFAFEVLLSQPAFERVVLPLTLNLKKLGIRADIRVVDSSQYINRLRDFDFDMIVAVFSQSLSPGNEQRWYWHSEAAGVPGTRNYCGIRNPAVDQLVESLIAATTRQELIDRCSALDRALVWGHFVIPHWYSGEFHVAYTAALKHPADLPPFDLALDTWWLEAR
ncbi:MAG: extracellular solute-binding protein, partial [Desulfosarcina sp.]